MQMLIVAVFVLGGAFIAQAQEFNATGLLRSITTNQIVWVEQLSAGDPGRLVTATRTPSTTIENCALDDVQRGAAIAVAFTEDSAGAKTASRILFRSCREVVAIAGSVVSVDGETLTVRNNSWDAPFAIGSEIAVTIAAEAQVRQCSNEPLVVGSLTPGRAIVVNGEVGPDGTSVRAVYLATTDDCPLTTYVEGVVDERSDTSLTVSSDVVGRFEAVVPVTDNATGQRDANQLGLTKCLGESVVWSEIVAGDTVQVLATLYPDGSAILGGVTVISNCPIELPFFRVVGLEGELIASNDDSIVVRMPRGREVAIRVDPTTFYGDCAGNAVDRQAIEPGTVVGIRAQRAGGVLTAAYVYALATCTQISLSVVIESNDAGRWSVRTESGRTAVVDIADDTRIVDCSGRERSATDPRLVDRTARLVIDASASPAIARRVDIDADCPLLIYTSGVITRLTDEEVEIDTMGFEVVLNRAATFFVDAGGESVSWDDLRVGQTVCMQYSHLPGLQEPIRAIVLVGVSCSGEPSTVPLTASGVVVENDGSKIVVRSKGEEIGFVVTSNTSVTGAATTAAVPAGAMVKVVSNERMRSLEPIASTIEVQNVTSVLNEIVASVPTVVWPNPASTEIQIASEDVVEVAIFDMGGRVLLTSTETSISIATLGNGMYVVRCRNRSDHYHTQLLSVYR